MTFKLKIKRYDANNYRTKRTYQVIVEDKERKKFFVSYYCNRFDYNGRDLLMYIQKENEELEFIGDIEYKILLNSILDIKDTERYIELAVLKTKLQIAQDINEASIKGKKPTKWQKKNITL